VNTDFELDSDLESVDLDWMDSSTSLATVYVEKQTILVYYERNWTSTSEIRVHFKVREKNRELQEV